MVIYPSLGSIKGANTYSVLGMHSLNDPTLLLCGSTKYLLNITLAIRCVARREIRFFPKYLRVERRMELDCHLGQKEMNGSLLDMAVMPCPSSKPWQFGQSRVTGFSEPRLINDWERNANWLQYH